ncbi:MAG: 1-acyl-sn-glycerol-3-phosphate acyltransferase [Oscillospiraceae bacterium]|nr:1-acyl-sn-glycerol-3-phosphate acyltransferase [Oscillospiraceae bacterium]
MNPQKQWLRPRHGVVRNIAYALLYPYTRWKYGITVEKFREQKGRQYLIVMNHQTAFDQFFVGMAFWGPVYYLATEDIFSIGWVSSLLRWAVAPIPIRKQTTDIQAVKNCIKVAREGGTIALAPEGNRTYSGRTLYMNPSIASLAKKLGLPVAIFRIEGGYGVQPRWSDVVRRGKMRAYVSQVIEPEEYAQMTNAELFRRIEEGLWVDEACVSGTFVHKKTAEYLERAMYVCPFCGLSEFESHEDIIRCKKCGRQIRYLPTKELEGVGFEFPHRFVAQWYDAQCDFVNGLDVTALVSEPVYRDRADLSEVIVYKRKNLLKKDADIALYGDRVTIDGQEYPFSELSAVTVLGKNKLNLYVGQKVYQLKGGKRFNALKYVNFYFRYKNIIMGNENGKFLGI